MAKEDIAKGPVGAKMIEMLEVPSFARGLKPSMLFDLAKDKGVISKEQQADFTKRVGKDRTALAEFNKIVTEAGEPRLAYRGQSPVQIEMIRAKGLTPATAANQPERINVIKQTNKIFNEKDPLFVSPEQSNININEDQIEDFIPSQVRLVQLFLNSDSEPKFKEMANSLQNRYNTDNLTDTVFKAIENEYNRS